MKINLYLGSFIIVEVGAAMVISPLETQPASLYSDTVPREEVRMSRSPVRLISQGRLSSVLVS